MMPYLPRGQHVSGGLRASFAYSSWSWFVTVSDREVFGNGSLVFGRAGCADLRVGGGFPRFFPALTANQRPKKKMKVAQLRCRYRASLAVVHLLIYVRRVTSTFVLFTAPVQHRTDLFFATHQCASCNTRPSLFPPSR